MSASNSRGSRCRTASISATSRSGAQHRAHVRPGCVRLDRHALGDPADELVGAKRLAGRRASTYRHLQLIGQPRAQPHQLFMAHPLGQCHHRRQEHPLGPGPVQGRRGLHLLQ